MVKNNEIMIGNTFLVGKGTEYEKKVVVDEVLHSCVGLHGREFHTFLATLEPIPITKELLLKNGFSKNVLIEACCDWDEMVEYEKQVDGYWFSFRNISNTLERDWCLRIDNSDRRTSGDCDVQYVHQAQNLANILGVLLVFEI